MSTHNDDDDDGRGERPSLLTLVFFLGVVFFIIAAMQTDRCREASAETLEEPSDPLALAVQALQPKLSTKLAHKHVEWARAAVDGTEIEVEQLLGMAIEESSLNPRSVSRLECIFDFCDRKTGVLRAWNPFIRGPYFCGVMQVQAGHSRKRCDALRADTALTYRVGAQELLTWLDDPYCRDRADRMRCALLGYGGGYPLIRRGKHRYPGKIERATLRLKRLAAQHAPS